MSAIDTLHSALSPSLRGISSRELRAALRGLEDSFEPRPKSRRQLTLRRLRFRGTKNGDFSFYPGVNVLRAGNDKGKSSVLKLIHYCLTGKNDLKKDVDGWIDQVELSFAIDGVPHAVIVAKSRRPRGRLVRGELGDQHGLMALRHLDALDGVETVLEFSNGKEMQQKLEAFFNQAFGLRPLMGTQKDSRKGSDALLDSPTSYRAYVRGMYINQDLGYTDLITDGVPYGNLFMKVVGMLLGVHGIDAFFAVEARLAHLENQLGKEERYHRRVEQSLGLRDLATLDEEIGKLERYIDEMKVERTARLVRATSGNLDQRLRQLTVDLVALEGAREQTARRVHTLELDARANELEIAELEAGIASHRSLSPIQPDRCPVCEITVEARRRFTEPEPGHCLLCHEDLAEDVDPEEMMALAEQRLADARNDLGRQRRELDARRAELEELAFKAEQLAQQKTHLQTQLRSAHQGSEDMDREIELETRYLGRLEAEREAAARIVSEEGGSANIKKLLRHKQILDAVLRQLRTLHADVNERLKEDFARRVEEYCTTIGFPGLEGIQLDANLKPRIRQNGKVYAFDELSPGEKVRFVLAFYLALTIATGEHQDYGAHPGLLLIDSPGKEEMVERDFEAVVALLRLIESQHADRLQVIVATTLKAISTATPKEKQIFVDNDDDPIFD